MKRVMQCFGVFCVLSLLAGCTKTKDMTNEQEENHAEFSYQLDDAAAFDVEDGNIWVASADSSIVVCYDENGEKINEVDLGDGESANLCVCEDDLVSFTYTDHANEILQYNLKNNEIIENALSPDITGAISMAATPENIYLIYRDDHFEEDGEESFDNYTYMGEKAVVINRSTFEMTDLDIAHVIGLYQVSDHEIIYYAHDDQGYYFTSYDCEKNQFGEKIYNTQIEYTLGFAVDSENNRVITGDFAKKALYFTALKDGEAKAEFANQIVILKGNDIQFENGYCYALNDMTKDVIRIDCKEAVKNNKELVFYHTMSMEDPYGCGYAIRTELLDEEEFALSVMAADDSYDFCMIDTREPKAYEMRKREVFYALNDVPGVKEYLDQCYAYIKDAATNDDGEIWMLPIAVDIPFLIYNDESCKQNNITMDQLDSYEDLLTIADELYRKPDARQWYSINGYQIQSDMINQYNEEQIRQKGKINYSTNEFQTICELMKKHSADEDESLHTWIVQPSEYSSNMDAYYENYILALQHYYDIRGWDETAYNKLRAKGLPGVSDEQKVHYGSCICLCVNPNSNNLDEALEYISKYCSYMMQREDVFLFDGGKGVPFSESQLAQDIYSIYKAGGITYELPEDIFWEAYSDYQDDKMELNELEEELTRKVNMYLYE